jgi:hypothetical protein
MLWRWTLLLEFRDVRRRVGKLSGLGLLRKARDAAIRNGPPPLVMAGAKPEAIVSHPNW